MAEATPRDTCMQIVGSGAFDYSWYQTISYNEAASQKEGDYVGWEASLGMEDPLTDETLHRPLNHETVMKALRALASKDNPPKYATSAARVNARRMFTDPDDADFDAASADEVVQIAVYGEIFFG